MAGEQPRVDMEFTDGNLGTTVSNGATIQLKVGTSSTGPIGVPVVVNSLAKVREIFGVGLLSSALASALTESGPVIGLRVPASVAGVNGAVTQVGTGTSELTVQGDPVDALSIKVRVTRSAASLVAATGAVIISVNGTDLPERAVPVNGVLIVPDSGLTVTLGGGTLVAGDSYSFRTTAPNTTLGEVAEVVEGFINRRIPVRLIHVVGAGTPALAAALDSILMAAEDRAIFTHAVMETRLKGEGESVAEYLDALSAEWASFVSLRVSVAREAGPLFNPLSRRFEIRPASWPATARRTTRGVGEDPSRVRSGALQGITELTVDTGQNATPGRFLSLTTYPGRQGVYVSRWTTMAPDGSDYAPIQNREVMDEAARAAYQRSLIYLGDDVVADLATGVISEAEALAIEADIAAAVRAQLGVNVSGSRVVIDRTINVISTSRMELDVLLTPLGYLREIKARLGFVNPATLIQAAAPAPTDTDTGGS